MEKITYESYLKVGELVGLQEPLSKPEAHDEMLFIIIHQVYELWFRQILHELDRGIVDIQNGKLLSLMKSLRRVTTIQDTLNRQVDILETMTPHEFNQFRDKLNPASGFQSYQFRMLEFALGLKNPSHLAHFKDHEHAYPLLHKYFHQKTLFDGFLQYLDQQGFAIPIDILERDVTLRFEGHDAVQEHLEKIYKNPDAHYELYLACELLVDIDAKLSLWRQRHVAMVRRMIGMRMGTGGSTGVEYLSTTLSQQCFPDLWLVRNRLGA